MSKLSDFIFLNFPPVSIVNTFSDGESASVAIATSAGKKILSGAVTADTYKSVLSVTGTGRISFVGVRREDATNRIVGLKLTIDGIVVFQSVSVTVASPDSGIYAVGAGGVLAGSTVETVAGNSIYFNSSFSVEISSNISETDKISAIVNYEVH